MAVVTTYKRGDGVVTGRSVATGLGSAVTYSGVVAWVLGGDSVYEFSNVKPWRGFEDTDNQQWIAAELGDACTMTIAVDGTIKLLCPTEQAMIDDC